MPRLTPDEIAVLLERFRRQLREHRLPVTRQRLAIAGVVFSAGDHPSVGELHRRLLSAGESVATATLYRTLAALVGMGLVREQDFGEGFLRYEPASPVRHDHLICERCGAVVEFAGDRAERMLRVSADEQRFLYRRHRLEVHGICESCRARDLAPPKGTAR